MKNFKKVDTSLIKSGKELDTVFTFEEKLTVDNVEYNDVKLPWVQGGCCDGKHLYEFMVSRDSLHCIIVKFDLATQKMIARSDDIMLGHANDGAYNPNDNTLAIVHCCDLVSPTSNIVYIVDAESLKLLRTYKLPEYDMFEITYNENTRQYITTSEKEMFYWDENFNLLDRKKIYVTPGWPSQGIECDGEYVYRLEFFLNKDSDGKILEMKNTIRVNDIETGKEVAVIPINTGLESENMFIHDGKFYLSCNNIKWTGCSVFSFEIIENK